MKYCYHLQQVTVDPAALLGTVTIIKCQASAAAYFNTRLTPEVVANCIHPSRANLSIRG
jgi:hypothetical protein